ncbi:protein-export chaperone SecB [Rhodocista pekingensis]|uniref:Protein-export protein SecB n=1 Tax=Rhodocista pekingensis TaxID=201185 RepID=A0ABW2KXH3_9PROT
MTDETAANGDNEAGRQSQSSSLPLVVNAQYVKDFSFENPNAPQSLMADQGQPKIDLQVDVQARGLNDTVSEVVLSMRAEATRNDRTAFIVELSYAGIFTLPAQIPAEQARAILLIEAPRLLFPFARQIVAEATQNGGYPPLMLQPLDFVDLYRRQVLNRGSNGEVGHA